MHGGQKQDAGVGEEKRDSLEYLMIFPWRALVSLRLNRADSWCALQEFCQATGNGSILTSHDLWIVSWFIWHLLYLRQHLSQKGHQSTPEVPECEIWQCPAYHSQSTTTKGLEPHVKGLPATHSSQLPPFPASQQLFGLSLLGLQISPESGKSYIYGLGAFSLMSFSILEKEMFLDGPNMAMKMCR